MAVTITQVSITTGTPQLIIAANTKRQELIITNNSTSPDAFIGPDTTFTSSTGLPLYAGQTRERSRGFSIWLGDVYGVTASGTADIRVWETTR